MLILFVDGIQDFSLKTNKTFIYMNFNVYIYNDLDKQANAY